MKDYIEERVLEVAQYIIDSKATIRKTAKVFGVSKSTIHKDMTERLPKIFSELDGNEGLLVASKIADRSGITRSVIVNALRKLESAGVIESRSLGMKGTFIRILNDKFITYIIKMNKFEEKTNISKF